MTRGVDAAAGAVGLQGLSGRVPVNPVQKAAASVGNALSVVGGASNPAIAQALYSVTGGAQVDSSVGIHAGRRLSEAVATRIGQEMLRGPADPSGYARTDGSHLSTEGEYRAVDRSDSGRSGGRVACTTGDGHRKQVGAPTGTELVVRCGDFEII